MKKRIANKIRKKFSGPASCLYCYECGVDCFICTFRMGKKPYEKPENFECPCDGNMRNCKKRLRDGKHISRFENRIKKHSKKFWSNHNNKFPW